MRPFIARTLLAVSVAVTVGVSTASASGPSLSPAAQAPASQTETALSRLMNYNLESAHAIPTSVDDGRAEASRCAHATAAASTYSSLVRVQATGDTPANIQWRIDFTRTDNYRVRQLSGDLVDEWITVGRDDYRYYVVQWHKLEGNAADVELKDSQRALNKFFAVDKFLHILAAAQPTSAAVYKFQDSRYVVLQYREQLGPQFTPVFSRTAEPSRMRMWIDVQTHLLVRAEVTAHAGAGVSQTAVQQTFAGYGRRLHIDAPDVVVSH